MEDCHSKFCIVGAGASGLAVAKNFRQAEIDFDVLEREDDVGGNWYYGKPASSVYRSTHLVSSKRLTEFVDFPMPDEYPDYPSHEQAWQYLCSYARAFDLYPRIQFNSAVRRIERDGDCWLVELASGARRRYGGLVIANGHNWDPRLPEYRGTFDGLTLHSSQYKTPEVLVGRRVLVVGAGNSGCDIAVESAQHAAATCVSMRRGYHYLPKFLFGKPTDACGERLLRWRLPLWLRRRIGQRLGHLALGSPQSFGLPEPDHRLFESHPIINSQLLYFVGHGRIRVKPDVDELCGDQVRFRDGSVEPLDVLIYATGFRISFPFIDRQYLNWQDDRPNLYLHAFHPDYDNFFVAGLIQPDSGQWGLVDRQARLMARFVVACRTTPARAEEFRRLKRTGADDLGAGIRYVRSTRHLLEVEHFSYRRRLNRLIDRFA